MYRDLYSGRSNDHNSDAIALARLRLHAQHPLITSIYLDWARHLEERIMFEHAAKWYAAHESQRPDLVLTNMQLLSD